MRFAVRSHVGACIATALLSCGGCGPSGVADGFDVRIGKHLVVLIDPVTCSSTSRLSGELQRLKLGKGWLQHVGLIGTPDLTADERYTIAAAFGLPKTTTFLSRPAASDLLGRTTRGVSYALFIGGRRVHSVANGSLRPDSALFALTTLLGTQQ